MKVLVQDIENEGLESLLGKKITLFCVNYIYTGKLIGINDTCIKLEDPAIVFETGAFTSASYKDVQALGVKEFYVSKQAIESFGVLK